MAGYSDRVTVQAIEEIADVAAVSQDLKKVWRHATADGEISPLELERLGQTIERLLREVPEATDAAEQADLQLELMVGCSRAGGLSERTLAKLVAASEMTQRQRLLWAARLELDTNTAA